MYVLPAGIALLSSRLSASPGSPRLNYSHGPVWNYIALVVTVIIGLRYRVGGDWDNYLRHFVQIGAGSFWDALSQTDPLYGFISWLSSELGVGIFGVNLVCAAIFAVGLTSFCKRLPRPWLGFAVAIPYLVIVVAMGYTRQGAAIGLAMIGLLALNRGSIGKFVFAVGIAAMAHKSAVLLLPVAALSSSRNKFWTIAWSGATGAVMFYFLLSKDVDSLYANYIVAEFQSQGALVRLGLNLIPAVIFIFYNKNMYMRGNERRLWKVLSYLSLGMFILFFITPASTALDRVALYLIPLQLVVFSNLPDAIRLRHQQHFQQASTHARLSHREGDAYAVTLGIVLSYGAVLFVWLNFGNYSSYWIPYTLYLGEN